MNKKFKNNRMYGRGFNDGYQKGIDDCEDDLINVKTQLQEERVINNELKTEINEIQDGFDKIECELVEVQANFDAESEKAFKAEKEAIKQSKRADIAEKKVNEQSERIDTLELTVDNFLDVLYELDVKYDKKKSEMESIMANKDSMEFTNKTIDLFVNKDLDPLKIKDDSVKEHIMALIRIKESNVVEIRRGERQFTKLQKEIVGINSERNKFKLDNFDLLASAVKNLTA